MKRLMIMFAATLSAAMLCVSGIAHATVDAITAYPVDINEPLSYLVSLITAAIGGAAVYLVGLIKRKTGINLSPEYQAYLDNSIASALLYAHDQAQQRVANFDDPMVKNKIIADAANVVLASVPNLLKHLGITPEKIRQMVEDQLNAAEARNGAAQPSQ